MPGRLGDVLAQCFEQRQVIAQCLAGGFDKGHVLRQLLQEIQALHAEQIGVRVQNPMAMQRCVDAIFQSGLALHQVHPMPEQFTLLADCRRRQPDFPPAMRLAADDGGSLAPKFAEQISVGFVALGQPATVTPGRDLAAGGQMRLHAQGEQEIAEPSPAEGGFEHDGRALWPTFDLLEQLVAIGVIQALPRDNMPGSIPQACGGKCSMYVQADLHH